jgi:hypothetical protein
MKDCHDVQMGFAEAQAGAAKQLMVAAVLLKAITRTTM